MTRATRVLALCCLLAFVLPSRAAAEWQFAPFVGFSFKGETNLNLLEEGVRDRHWNLGGAVRLVGAGPLGLEAIGLYAPGFFQTTHTTPVFADAAPGSTITHSRTFALMGNLVLTTPRGWNEYGLRPFVSGGFGLLHVYATDDLRVFPTRANLSGYNVGGGAVGFLTDRVGLRFDLRYYRTLPPGREQTEQTRTIEGDRVRLRYWTGTLGVAFKY